jgi:putative tryptophan/tyrosine transport system substrate-binding protein
MPPALVKSWVEPIGCRRLSFGADMRRREFIGLVGAATAVWPLTGSAQQRGRLPRVGILWHAGSAEEEAIYLGALEQGLKSLGYVDGRTITLEARFPNEQPDRFASLATELVALKVDALVAVTPLAALAAQRATTTIPIVFILVPDPVERKLVNSLARPGGNITGLTNTSSDLTAKRLEYLKEAFPSAKRVALLVNANDQQAMRRYISESKLAATALGLDVQPMELRSAGDIEQVFDKIAEGRLEVVVAVPDGLLYQGRKLIAQSALARRLPLIVWNRETLQAGGLMSYGADVLAIFRRAATYVDKVLKGEAPADLPVEQPTKFEFLVNLKTAKALGLDLPPTLLTRADEVIE